MFIKDTIKKLDTFKEGNTWYVSMIVERETDKDVTEFHIPKVELINVNERVWFHFSCDGSVYLSFGGCTGANTYSCKEGDVVLDSGKGKRIVKASYTERLIKEKTQELTLEEIEKKLGYKVKIVSNK